MAEPRSPRPSRTRLIVSCVLVLVIGVLSLLLGLFPMLLLAAPVLLAFLYAYAGFVPAVLGAALAAVISLVAFGPAGLAMTLCALILPAAAIIRAIHTRAPFRTQLITALVSLVGGMVAALGIAYLAIGSDIIGALMESFKGGMEALPANVLDLLLANSYDIPGAPATPTTEQILAGFLTEAQRADYLALFLSDMHAALALTLPGILLSSATLSGVLAVAWPGHLLRHTIPEDDPARMPLYRWYTPHQVSLGLLVTLGASYLLAWQKVAGGDAVFLTMQAILITCFEIQAVASAERRLRAFGAKASMRATMIVLALVFLGEAAAVYGGVSALFGSTGAVRQLMAKRADKT